MHKFDSNYQDDDSQSIGLSFIKTYNLWHKAIKQQLSTLQLTHPQFIVLASVGYLSQHQTEVTQIAISRQSDIDVMTISTIVKNLQKAELISRQESKKDTRAKVVTLTEAGQKLLNQALPLVEAVDAKFFGALQADQEQFNALLLRLIQENVQ